VRSRAAGSFAVLACVVSSFWRLGTHPALFWDEGWTLAAARNWVELGWVGQLLQGVPESLGLAGQVEVVAPVALSFPARRDLLSPPGSTTSVEVPITDVMPASYLARLQVDGAHSPLSSDATGAFVAPLVVVP